MTAPGQLWSGYPAGTKTQCHVRYPVKIWREFSLLALMKFRASHDRNVQIGMAHGTELCCYIVRTNKHRRPTLEAITCMIP